MTHVMARGHRTASAAVLALGGGALATATWVGGDHILSIGLIAFYVIAAGLAYVWAGRDSDVGAIMRVGGDERQRRLDRDATALSGLAMGLTAIAGAIVSAARNHVTLANTASSASSAAPHTPSAFSSSSVAAKGKLRLRTRPRCASPPPYDRAAGQEARRCPGFA